MKVLIPSPPTNSLLEVTELKVGELYTSEDTPLQGRLLLTIYNNEADHLHPAFVDLKSPRSTWEGDRREANFRFTRVPSGTKIILIQE